MTLCARALDPYAAGGATDLPPLTGGATYAPYNEYEQYATVSQVGVNCIAFNLTGVAGFTYKGHKPIRKEVSILFRTSTVAATNPDEIFDFGIDGLDMYYYSTPNDMPGAAFHLANSSKPTSFLTLDDGSEVPFIEKPAAFKTAYEDTNIVGISLMTQLAFSRIETTTQDSPEAVVSYSISAVSAQLDEEQINTRFCFPYPCTDQKSVGHVGLIMVFVGPEITQYFFTPPQVGALLGQLGGLKGLLVDFWILSIAIVLYLDKVLDPSQKYNVNKGKFILPTGAIVVGKPDA